jgi:hypothetical protein
MRPCVFLRDIFAVVCVLQQVYETTFYFCFLPHSELNNSMGWTDGLLMVPVTVFVVATFASYVMICIRLYRVAGTDGFRANWRLLALVLYLMITLFIWVLWYWVDIRGHGPTSMRTFEEYAICVALAYVLLCVCVCVCIPTSECTSIFVCTRPRVYSYVFL